MTKDAINNLFESEEMNNILSHFSKENNLRLCLNKNIVEKYRQFFGKIITLSFVVDILPNELDEINTDVEKYLSKKLSTILNIKEIYNHKKEVEKYLNNTLGKKQILFHGTNSIMESQFLNNSDLNYFLIEPCRIIDNIYKKHSIYKAFEGGIQDYEAKNFWITTSPNSACFYSLQSPEYFARFASRSDYYKQDIYKYDRNAYYRKDFKSCVKNIKTELKEFHFNKKEKKIILNNFTTMWKSIVHKDFKNIIFYREIQSENIHHFNKNDKLFDMVLKYFTKVHFKYDINNFKIDFKQIILPNIKQYLKRYHPILNHKFIIINGKKYIPDFYFGNKYSYKRYFTLDKKQSHILEYVNNAISSNKQNLLIELVNEAFSNTHRAKKFFKQKSIPTIPDVIEYYKNQFNEKVQKLESSKTLASQTALIEDISTNTGLKYIISLRYNKYFKDVSTYNIYQYRKYLGVKLCEHYDGIPIITKDKINILVKLYKQLLDDKDFAKNTDIPLRIINDEITVVE